MARSARIAGSRTDHCAMEMVMRSFFTGGWSHSHWILPQAPCVQRQQTVSPEASSRGVPCQTG